MSRLNEIIPRRNCCTRRDEIENFRSLNPSLVGVVPVVNVFGIGPIYNSKIFNCTVFAGLEFQVPFKEARIGGQIPLSAATCVNEHEKCGCKRYN